MSKRVENNGVVAGFFGGRAVDMAFSCGKQTKQAEKTEKKQAKKTDENEKTAQFVKKITNTQLRQVDQKKQLSACEMANNANTAPPFVKNLTETRGGGACIMEFR